MDFCFHNIGNDWEIVYLELKIFQNSTSFEQPRPPFMQVHSVMQENIILIYLDCKFSINLT